MNQVRKYIKQILTEMLENPNYIYHGTGKGQALNIQKDGFMKPNKTGEEQPSISFTNDLNYAKYYAQAKGGTNKMAILRTKLTDKFFLSPRITNNKGDEYITFEKVPTSQLEILTNVGTWEPLNKWNVIFDELLESTDKEKQELLQKVKQLFPYDGNKMFMRNNETDTVFYPWSTWLFKNFNRDKLNTLKVGESIQNSKGTVITIVY
jgi:hypothetical protein